MALSEDLVSAIDQYSDGHSSRSASVEAISKPLLEELVSDERKSRGLEIINQRADRLNEEAVNVLCFQT